MRRLETTVICNTRLLILRDGDKTYYINTASGLAFEDRRELELYECPDGGVQTNVDSLITPIHKSIIDEHTSLQTRG